MNSKACMGGFCLMREDCRLYHHPAPSHVDDRLCEPNQLDAFEPIRIFRQPSAWERSAAESTPPVAPATPATPAL